MENFDLEKDQAPEVDAILELVPVADVGACLYVVATPIGNLGDVSPRMRDTLAMVDVVAAEDTRVTAQLLALLGLKKPLIPSHGHNEKASAQTLIEKLQAGQNVALVSDAGTPAVSDPGAWVVKCVAAAGFPVVPVPGPSAVLAAVAGSGLVEGPFYFAGFMPSKGAARSKALAAVLERPESVILFEAPHRIAALFDDMLLCKAHLRECCVARELTKKFETFYRGTTESVGALLAADNNGRRGEFVIVLGPKPQETSALALASVNPFELLDALLEHLPNKTAVKLVAQTTGAPRNALYDHALKKGDDCAG